MSFLDVLKSKQSFIEGSQTNLPVGGSNESLSEVIGKFIDPVNRRQFSILKDREKPFHIMLDSYAYAVDEYDIDGFLEQFVMDMDIYSASVNGERSKQVQNIAVGQMNREFATELARIRSGDEGSKELKDVV